MCAEILRLKQVKKFFLLETFKDKKLNLTQIIIFISICMVFRGVTSLFFSEMVSNLYTVFFLIIYLLIITHKELLRNIKIIAKLLSQIFLIYKRYKSVGIAGYDIVGKP